MRTPAHPGLYDAEASPLSLSGTRCRACGRAFFPPLRLGCEVCGAPEDDLADVSLAGRGRLHSFATVHLHRGAGIEAPFTVAEVVLDDGPVIRATMAQPTDDGLRTGQRVEAVWVVTKVGDSGSETVEPRFQVVA